MRLVLALLGLLAFFCVVWKGAQAGDPEKKKDPLAKLWGPEYGTLFLQSKEDQERFVKKTATFKGRRLVLEHFPHNDALSSMEEGDRLRKVTVKGLLAKSFEHFELSIDPDSLESTIKNKTRAEISPVKLSRCYLIFNCTKGDLKEGNIVLDIIPHVSFTNDCTHLVDNTKKYQRHVITLLPATWVLRGFSLRELPLGFFSVDKPNADVNVKIESQFFLSRFTTKEDLTNANFLDRLYVTFYCEKGSLKDDNWLIEAKREK